MKNILLSIAMLFVILTQVTAQDQYTQGMQQAFKLWSENKTTAATGLFERITNAEKEKWQPAYYAANVLITSSFMATETATKMANLEKAKKYIDIAHERSADNSEIHTLEGLLYTGYVAMDPQTYAMQYSNTIVQLHEKAIQLDPNNPRALSNKIEWEMGSARFFGQDLQPYCDRLQEILVKFDQQDTTQQFSPTYGKDRVQEVINNCGK